MLVIFEFNSQTNAYLLPLLLQEPGPYIHHAHYLDNVTNNKTPILPSSLLLPL